MALKLGRVKIVLFIIYYVFIFKALVIKIDKLKYKDKIVWYDIYYFLCAQVLWFFDFFFIGIMSSQKYVDVDNFLHWFFNLLISYKKKSNGYNFLCALMKII